VRILLVNANTSDEVTRIAADEARAAASSGTQIVPVTAAFGARVIRSKADNAIALHACLDAVARHVARCDAVVVAVSLDTAVEELSELLDIPVLGMTGSALAVARARGGRFGVLTAGAAMMGLFQRRFPDHGASAVECIDIGPREALDDRSSASRLMARAVSALGASGLDVAVPIGVTFAGLPRAIRGMVSMPVLDGIACAVGLAERRLNEAPDTARARLPANNEYVGLSEALTALMASNPA
jgi:allantoin racemase